MLSVSSGHSADYLLNAVAAGRENYYTGASAEGEPPGRWQGAGAENLGLVGEVDAQDMNAVYERFIDPRDERFRDPEQWDEAEVLGHAGRKYKTADQIYADLVGTEPGATPERRAQLRIEAGQKARKNTGFHDLTFSPQKSVTVLHSAFEAQEIRARKAGDSETAAAWATYKQSVEDAIWVGNNAMLDYVSRRAGFSRVGHHGGQSGRWIDAHNLVVASFFQHDSRDRDPQLHIHNAVLNRVECADGEWRSIDSRALHRIRAGAGAIAERAMEEYLSRQLGVAFETRPDGKAREIVGVPQKAIDLLSSRRRRITKATEKLVGAFQQRHGREPTSLELDRLKREATFSTRKAKSHKGETTEQRLDRAEARIRAELDLSFAEVAATVLQTGPQRDTDAAVFSPTAVKQAALAEVQRSDATWTRAQLARAISNQLPGYLGGLDAGQVEALIEGLTDEALGEGAVRITATGPAEDSQPGELRLQDGRSAYDRPGGALYATEDQLAAEQALSAAAREQAGVRASAPDAEAWLDRAERQLGYQLGADQRAALQGILTTGTSVQTLIGPAGAGKSTVMGVLAHAWADKDLWDGREQRVVGLATSQLAAGNLADEGLTAFNITRWLAMQARIAEARAAAGDDTEAGWQQNEGVLRAGDLVVVDEAAMTSTEDLHAIHRYAREAGAMLLLSGDHYQLAAVGAGGAMKLVSDEGTRWELTDVRRFNAAWERQASLRLRSGDAAVLQDYRKHGRIVDAGTTESAEYAAMRAYLADALAGTDSVLVADSNERADRLSADVRAELVRLGKVEETGVRLARDGNTAGVGDLVQTRRNGWDLASFEGNSKAPINRERYIVREVREDGSLVVDQVATGTRLRLDAEYVRNDLTLGYASTAYAVQGLTVSTSHTVASAGSTPAGFYVPMTRGRDCNTAYVATQVLAPDAEPGEGQKVVRHDPVDVLSGVLEQVEPERSATAEAALSQAEMGSAQTILERLAEGSSLAAHTRTVEHLDRLQADGVLSPGEREELAASDALGGLAGVLRRAELAGHDPYRLLRDAARGSLAGLRDPARGLISRIVHRHGNLAPQLADSYQGWVPADVPDRWKQHLSELAAAADQRHQQLASELVTQPPGWATEAIGAVPTEPAEQQGWADRAAAVAMHRELTQHDATTSTSEAPTVQEGDMAAGILPAAPSAHQHPELYASWSAAWNALGSPEAAADETAMTPGQLYARVRAWEREQTWQPAYVAQDLAGTSQAEATQRRLATIRAAEADAATDPTEQDQLHRQATEAQALADALAQQREQLEQADEIRAEWYVHTAATRSAGQRARVELDRRNLAPEQLGDRTTAAQWLVEHHHAETGEDEHRQITEADLIEEQQAAEAAAEVFADTREQSPEGDGTDIRETTRDDAPVTGLAPERDWTHVPDQDTTKATIERARRALAEMQRRENDQRRSRRTRDDPTDPFTRARWRTGQRDQAKPDQRLTL